MHNFFLRLQTFIRLFVIPVKEFFYEVNNDNIKSILDYGCGHGFFLIRLAKLFPHKKFIGVDIDAKKIKYAIKLKKKENLNNVEFKLLTNNGWTVLQRKFDLIFIVSVLYLLPHNNAKFLFEKIKLLLSTNNSKILLFEVLKQNTLKFKIAKVQEKIMTGLGLTKFQKEIHFYSLDEISSLLKYSNLKIIKIKKFTYTFFPDQFLLTIKP